MSKHISNEQKEIMLDFLKARPKLYAGKFSPDFTLNQSRAQWQELTDILNSHPNGAKKEWNSWCKCWIDIKKNTKAKLAKNKKHKTGTGGGPPVPDNMETFESKVLELITPVCVTGNEHVPEPTIMLDDELPCEILLNETLDDVDHVDHAYPTPSTSRQPLTDKNTEEDHAYPTPSLSRQPLTNKNTGVRENENVGRTKVLTESKKSDKSTPRVTKSKRLSDSIKNHTRMVDNLERGMTETNTYRSEKLKLLKEQQSELKQQTIIMQSISDSLSDILKCMTEFI